MPKRPGTISLHQAGMSITSAYLRSDLLRDELLLGFRDVAEHDVIVRLRHTRMAGIVVPGRSETPYAGVGDRRR